MSALAIAGIAAAIASIASGAMGIASKKREQERANAYNREMSDLQFQRELQIMNFQNEYNSPINQRKRLEEAGYNPNFVDAANMSADAVAPETAPYEMQDYSGDISQMINSPIGALQTYFGLQQQNEALKSQKLLNEYRDQQVIEQKEGYSNLFAAQQASQLIDMYHKLISKGVDKNSAFAVTIGRDKEWFYPVYPYARKHVSAGGPSEDTMEFLGNLGEIQHRMFETEDLLKSTQLSQAMSDYNFTEASYGTRLNILGLQSQQLEVNTYEMAQKMKYAKQVAEYIKKQDGLSDFQKTSLIIGANSFIYNGQDSGLNILNYVSPIQFAKSIMPRKPTPINKTNNYNYNLQTEKTNIINN